MSIKQDKARRSKYILHYGKKKEEITLIGTNQDLLGNPPNPTLVKIKEILFL